MDELWPVFVLIFAAVLLAVQAIYWLVSSAQATQKSVNRRLALAQQLANPTAVLQALREERGFADHGNPLLGSINDFLTQTGSRIDRKVLVAWVVGLCVAFLAVSSIALGFGFLSVLIAVCASPAATFLFLRLKRNRRRARFSGQLPDALDVIVRGVRVGHPFSTAMGLVAKEMSDPIGTEFGMASDEITFGLDVRRAVGNLYRRVGQEDLLFLVVAINIQNQTGGNLAEVLSRLSRLIRNRMKVRAKIKSLTAEGRMSAIVLSLVPVILFVLLNFIAPGYYSYVYGHPATMTTLFIGLGLMAVGNLIMYRMVHFKF